MTRPSGSIDRTRAGFAEALLIAGVTLVAAACPSQAVVGICTFSDLSRQGRGVLVRARVGSWNPDGVRHVETEGGRQLASPISVEVLETISTGTGDGAGVGQLPAEYLVLGVVTAEGASTAGELTRARDADAYFYFEVRDGVGVLGAGGFFWRSEGLLFNGSAYDELGLLESSLREAVVAPTLLECDAIEGEGRRRPGD